MGPSAIPECADFSVPRALSVAEIEDLVSAFGRPAQRAFIAGFEIIEICGAHGYPIHSFFPPISNQRDDPFGGTVEKRMRFPLLVAEAVREIWPADQPIFYRTSVVDSVPGGISVADTVLLAQGLKTRGVDLIDCSTGGMSGLTTLASVQIRPGSQVKNAATVRAGASAMIQSADSRRRRAVRIWPHGTDRLHPPQRLRPQAVGGDRR